VGDLLSITKSIDFKFSKTLILFSIEKIGLPGAFFTYLSKVTDAIKKSTFFF
jgi:hypothetical protein